MRWFVRIWWPLLAILGVVIAVQVWWTGRFDVPGGHASGHFMNASAIFGISAATTVLLWALPMRERRQPVLWVLAALVVASALAITVANVRVVEAIGTNNWSAEKADALGPSRPGFLSGHDLAEQGDWAIALSAVLLAGWLGGRKAVRRWVAVVAGFLSLIVGIGVFALAIAAVVDRARRVADETLASSAGAQAQEAGPDSS
jgi:hypothetical protein